MNRRICALSLFFISTYVFATDIINTQTKNTITQDTIINTTHIASAKEWNLNETEWKQYEMLMQGSSGRYYKKLSPPEVLGINAENPEQLRHYAEIAATLEHDKLERELRFNAAFHEAAMRRYPIEPIIKPFDYTPFTPISQN